MSEVLIRCENVGKKFCRDLKRSLWYGVQDSVADMLGRRSSRNAEATESNSAELRRGEFWANKDISFELKRGECLGLLGGNGAGKTTLLKMLNGLIKPDDGHIETRGQVGALIALGAGFNPILTGRENVFINGSILGLSRYQINDKFEEIVDFAELNDFIDTPVRNYSSGMQVRLGFACAVILVTPDILILDEVLAVGDAGFRAKCYAKISDFAGGAAVVLVSHNVEAISRICDRGILLQDGTIKLDGDAITATQQYSNSFAQESTNLTVAEGFGARELICEPSSVEFGGHIVVRFCVDSPTRIPNVLLKINILTLGGKLVSEFNTRNEGLAIHLHIGENRFAFQLKNLRLLPKDYLLAISIISERSRHLVWWRNALRFTVTGNHQGHQEYQIEGLNLPIQN